VDITLTKTNLSILHLLKPTRSMDSLIDQYEINPLAGRIMKTFGLDLGGWIGFAYSTTIWCIYILVLNFPADFVFGMYLMVFLLHFRLLGEGIMTLLKSGYKFSIGLSGLQASQPNFLQFMAGPDYIPSRFLSLACVEGGCYAKKPKLQFACVVPRNRGKVLQQSRKTRKR
jgi:hypothetical protein